MNVGPAFVDRFLRISIFASVVCFALMLVMALVPVWHWSVWIAPLIADTGVIISFAVHLNGMSALFGKAPAAKLHPQRGPATASS